MDHSSVTPACYISFLMLALIPYELDGLSRVDGVLCMDCVGIGWQWVGGNRMSVVGVWVSSAWCWGVGRGVWRKHLCGQIN